jgi:glycoside/pentoside/hexuronide:cation symporter, GPH family
MLMMSPHYTQISTSMRKAKLMSNNALVKLGLGTKLGYAAGDFGLNLVWNAMSMFMIFFYTDILGISAWWAGFAFMVASIWDGITDPIMGSLADRTRNKYGSYRPYLLYGMLPLAICLVLAFLTPKWPQAGLVVYATLSHMLLRTAYTVVSIPYGALTAALTEDANERSSLAGLRMQAAALGAIAVAILLQALPRYFQPEPARGFFIGSIVLGAVMCLAIWVCFRATRGARNYSSDAIAAQPPMSLSTLAKDWLVVLSLLKINAPLRKLFLALMAFAFASTFFAKNILYHFKYALSDSKAGDLALPILAFALIVACPFWVLLAKRTSKRFVWLIASAMMAVVYLMFYFNPSSKPIITVAIIGLSGVATAAFYVMFWAMLPDTIEVNEAATGERHEGKVFGFANFALKVALGLAALGLGAALELIGFRAGETQTAETLYGLRLLMVVLPMLGLVVGAWLLWGYDLGREKHAALLEQINKRKDKLA